MNGMSRLWTLLRRDIVWLRGIDWIAQTVDLLLSRLMFITLRDFGILLLCFSQNNACQEVTLEMEVDLDSGNFTRGISLLLADDGVTPIH